MIKFIETKRLILSPLSAEDLKGSYLNWINAQETDMYTQHALFPHTLESLQDYYASRKNSRSSIWLGIFLKDGNAHIGNIDISNIDWVNRSGIYNILIGDTSAHNKGYALEASAALLHHVFNNLNLERIQLGVHAGNEAAVKLYSRLGFVQEGLLRKSQLKNGIFSDTVVMGLLRSEFHFENFTEKTN